MHMKHLVRPAVEGQESVIEVGIWFDQQFEGVVGAVREDGSRVTGLAGFSLGMDRWWRCLDEGLRSLLGRPIESAEGLQAIGFQRRAKILGQIGIFGRDRDRGRCSGKFAGGSAFPDVGRFLPVSTGIPSLHCRP